MVGIKLNKFLKLVKFFADYSDRRTVEKVKQEEKSYKQGNFGVKYP